MGRYVSRPRMREGRGLGEVLAEYFVMATIVAIFISSALFVVVAAG